MPGTAGPNVLPSTRAMPTVNVPPETSAVLGALAVTAMNRPSSDDRPAGNVEICAANAADGAADDEVAGDVAGALAAPASVPPVVTDANWPTEVAPAPASVRVALSLTARFRTASARPWRSSVTALWRTETCRTDAASVRTTAYAAPWRSKVTSNWLTGTARRPVADRLPRAAGRWLLPRQRGGGLADEGQRGEQLALHRRHGDLAAGGAVAVGVQNARDEAAIGVIAARIAVWLAGVTADERLRDDLVRPETVQGQAGVDAVERQPQVVEVEIARSRVAVGERRA